MTDHNNIVRIARQAAGVTTTEAGQLVHVTRRTFEQWESGDRQIPAAKLELLIAKLNGQRPEGGQLLAFFGGDIDQATLIDVVAEDNFLSLKEYDDGTATISSLAVERHTGRPYVHRQRFSIEPHNVRVTKIARSWVDKVFPD